MRVTRTLQGEYGPIPDRVNCLNCGASSYRCSVVNVSDRKCCATCDIDPDMTHPRVVVDTSKYDEMAARWIAADAASPTGWAKTL